MPAQSAVSQETLWTEPIMTGAYRDGCAELSTLCGLTTGSIAYDPSMAGRPWVSTGWPAGVQESAHKSASENECLRWRRNFGAEYPLDGKLSRLQGTR